MTLLKKAVRDIWNNRRAYIACVVLIAIGVATYVAYHMAYLNLSGGQQAAYAQQRFADVFATVRGMPTDQARRLTNLPGVSDCAGRIRYQARVLREDADTLADIIINSYDPAETEPINAFSLEEGEHARGGLILGQDFALANGLGVGDTIRLNFLGRAQEVPITGIATAAEYIYNIRNVADMFPDPLKYGYGYMDYRDLAALTGQEGWVNSVVFLLEPGVTFDEVRYAIEDALAPYGLVSLLPRKDHPSHSMLDMEINSIGTMSNSMPMMFIIIAAVLLYIMLKRIIGQERTQIGMLKAYGHSTGQILLHYLCYGTAVGFAGGLAGGILSLPMSNSISALMLAYFSLPPFSAGVSPAYLFGGIFIATAAGALGSLFGTWSVLRLNPGEAMRPAAPPPVRFDWLSRLKALQRVLAASGRMALRSIDRARFRSAFVAAGVMIAFAIMALFASYTNMFDALVFDQYTKVQRYDMKLTLDQPAGYTSGMEEAWTLPGVTAAEGILEVPAGLSAEHRNTATILTGLEADSALYHLYDTDLMVYVALPAGGVVLSKGTADELEVAVGDILTIKSPYLPADTELPVMAVVSQSVGSGCYLTLDTLWDILQTDPTVSAVVFNTDAADQIKPRLIQAGNMAGLVDKTEAMEQYQTLLGSFSYLIWSLQIIGIVIAFAIISATSSVALAERKREYATLRVLGMQPQEVGQILTFEYWLLTAAGAVLGIPMTIALKMALRGMFDPKLFTLPLYTPPYCYLIAAAGCAAAVFLASRSMVKQVTKFDLIEVLKERE